MRFSDVFGRAVSARARVKFAPLKLALALLGLMAASGMGRENAAHAQPPPDATSPITVFSYGMHGLVLGSVLGLSTGYIVARSGGWDNDQDWRTLGYGAGIGALVGAGVGIGLGVTDVASNQPGLGRLILDDMGAGASFGAAVGLVGGAIAWMSSKEPERLLFGSAIGTLAGAGLGAAIAIVQWESHPRYGTRADRGGEDRRRARSWTLSVATARETSGGLCALPVVVGRF